MSKTCSFEGCERKHYGKGLCAGHYQQLRRGEELRPLRKKISKAEAERLRAQGLKKCSDCDQVKPLEEFSKLKSTKDGRNYRCKACEAEHNRQWAKKNPDKARAKEARRRARKLNAQAEPINWDTLRDVWGENPMCIYCREAPFEHWDHIIPLAGGGQHVTWNLAPACASCNTSKHARDVVDWYLPRVGLGDYV